MGIHLIKRIKLTKFLQDLAARSIFRSRYLRDKLFKDFGRLSVKPTGGEKSTGLGLAICRKIVEAHHGTIVAENLTGGGCEFRVTLPVPS